MHSYVKPKKVGIYRSSSEKRVSKQLKKNNIKFTYEKVKIEWEDLYYRKYTPDFILENNIIIEVKGYFKVSDRRKQLYIKEQNPDLDIRFVFDNSKAKIYKGSKTTYASWCTKYGFLYCDLEIPKEWFKEKNKLNIKNNIILFKGINPRRRKNV